MSVESLKEQARRHEQREEWRQALALYRRASEALAEEDAPDVGLYNRIGDLCIRVGDVEQALENYEQAVDLYAEAELPHNAIAVCKKIIRNMPERSAVYLKMGRIRARQGFMTDARQSFLVYAERVRSAGDKDEALRAILELADLSSGDVEIRLALAEQLRQYGHDAEALDQLRAAHSGFVALGDLERADGAAQAARAIDPSIELTAPESEQAADDVLPPLGGSEAVEPEIGVDLGDIVIPGPAEEAPEAVAEPEAPPPKPLAGLEGAWPSFAFDDDDEGEGEGGDEDDKEAQPLPLLHFEVDDEPVRTADAPEVADRDGIGGEPSPGKAESHERDIALPQPAGESRTPASPEELIAAGDLEGARTLLADLVESDPSELSYRRLMVEIAFRQGDRKAQAEAYLELARVLERTGSGAHAARVYQQVLQLDPGNEAALAASGGEAPADAPDAARVASSEEYVDLGALIFDDDEEEKTRLRVAYEEPTGDENSDFGRMLDRFRARISENLEPGDVRAHHDLGLAYKEMGLIEEAIEEFQAAIRGSEDHLPTYELLGQCLLERGESESAVRSLSRALELPVGVEEELLGIYYYLGRAHEAEGNKESAVEFYERVFSLDINFMDVTERLRALR